jgi:hypothetical protein
MKKYTAILMVFLLVSGCVSRTNIITHPHGADVFIDNVKVGITPLQYSDTAIAGTSKALKLEKEGYVPFETVIRKSEFEWGPCIGGIFFLFPFVWILGYPETYEFELDPGKKLSNVQQQNKYPMITGIVLNNKEIIYGEILNMNAEKVEIQTKDGKIKTYQFNDVEGFTKTNE